MMVPLFLNILVPVFCTQKLAPKYSCKSYAQYKNILVPAFGYKPQKITFVLGQILDLMRKTHFKLEFNGSPLKFK